MKKSDKRLKRKIGALLVLGVFAVLMLTQSVAAIDVIMTDDDWIGFSDAEGRIVFDDQTPDEIEMLDARIGIGDTSPDFKLEVTGSSGSGYFGVTSSSDGDIFIIDSNGKVGIGTSTPNAKFVVETTSGGAAEIGSSGNLATGDHAVALGHSTTASGDYSLATGWSTTASNSYSTAMGGYDTTASGECSFAIGYSSSAEQLCSVAIGGFDVESSGTYSFAAGSFVEATATSSFVFGRGLYAVTDRLTNNIEKSFMVGFDSTTPTLFVDGSSVGIGVTDPAAKLEIDGNLMFDYGRTRQISVQTDTTSDNHGDDLAIVPGHGFSTGGASNDGGDLILGGGEGHGTGAGGNGGDVYVFGGEKATNGVDGNVILAYVPIYGARGKVGIGTTSPGATLDVRGSAIFNEDSGDNDFRIEGNGDANLFFGDASIDRIGIGVNDPGEKLEVSGNIMLSNGADRTILVEQSPSVTAGYDLTVQAGNAYAYGGIGWYTGGDLILRGGDGDGDSGSHGGDVFIYGGAPDTSSDDGDVILAHTSSATRGKVGIGVTDPDTELEVNGEIKQKVTTSNVANPPTDAQLDTLWTSPATQGDGWTAYLKDSDSDNLYQIVAVGTEWYIFSAVKAT